MIANLLKYNEIPSSLSYFLLHEDTNYLEKINSIPLFHKEKTSKWTALQKKSFAAIFYHIRGHFVNFMWHMANFSTDPVTKKIIIENMYEELGTKNKLSHEVLYQRFALECGVDIKEEIVNEGHYLEFAKQFNKGHLQWLAEGDEEDHICAFAAYERLDNIDYPYLTDFATSIKISPFGTTFFRIHIHVEHFSALLKKLIPIWENTPEKVEKSFHFINSHQYKMWQQLSETIFSLEG